jgi:DNA-binding CsgD family transcriptional regulator
MLKVFPDGSEAETRRRRSRSRTENASTRSAAALSPRELEVLRHISAGTDNLKIAAVLGITERTVKAHVHSLYRKLQVENRVEMALEASRWLGSEGSTVCSQMAPGPELSLPPALKHLPQLAILMHNLRLCNALSAELAEAWEIQQVELAKLDKLVRALRLLKGY